MKGRRRVNAITTKDTKHAEVSFADANSATDVYLLAKQISGVV